jgi:hypothetical protein
MTDPRIEEIRTLLPQAMLLDWVRLGSRLVRLMRDRLHPQAHDAVLERLLAQARALAAVRDHHRPCPVSFARPSASSLPTLPRRGPHARLRERAHGLRTAASKAGSKGRLVGLETASSPLLGGPWEEEKGTSRPHPFHELALYQDVLAARELRPQTPA